MANHISNADPLALGQFLAYSGRWPRFLAKSSLFGVPGLGRLLRRVGQIPVERGSSRSVDALVAAQPALEEGRAVVVYPEGTITRDPDLWPMRGHTGAARLALATPSPSCRSPSGGRRSSCAAASSGCRAFWARPTLRMRVGPPVALDDLRGRPVDAALLAEATERIMAALTSLLEELRGERPRPSGSTRAPDGPGARTREGRRRWAPARGARPSAWSSPTPATTSRCGRAGPSSPSAINATRRNPDYLPDVELPPNLRAVSDPAEAMDGAYAVVLAVPSQLLRADARGLERARATPTSSAWPRASSWHGGG